MSRVYVYSDWRSRFWSKVDRRGEDECWPWLASLDREGYGQLGNDDRSRSRKAHRVAFLIAHGRDIRSDCLRHTCDRPACVNPRHLIEGSRADNVADAWGRGRMCPAPTLRGDLSPTGKLKDIQRAELRFLSDCGLSTSELMLLSGVKNVRRAMALGAANV